MIFLPGTGPPGGSHPVGVRGTLQRDAAADTRSGGDPSEPRHGMPVTTRHRARADRRTRFLTTTTKPPQHRDRVQGRQRRSGCLIRIADECRGWFLKGRQVDALKKRDLAMAEAQRLMAVAKPLKEKTEATLARGGAVSDSRWRRLERLSSQIQAALDLSHRYHSEWQKENENK